MQGAESYRGKDKSLSNLTKMCCETTAKFVKETARFHFKCTLAKLDSKIYLRARADRKKTIQNLQTFNSSTLKAILYYIREKHS